MIIVGEIGYVNPNADYGYDGGAKNVLFHCGGHFLYKCT